MKTSPRTSAVAGSARRSGIARDRPEVGRDVLAGRAVAAGGALHEAAALEAEGDGQAVDLELRDVAQVGGRFRGRGQAEPAPDPGVEGAQLVVAERVREAEHRPAVADLGEDLAGRCATDALGRRVVGRELRVGRLERHELAEELVVLGVAELRGVLAVVLHVRPVDDGGQLGMTGRGRLDVERRGGLDQGRVDGRELDGHAPEGTRQPRRAARRAGRCGEGVARRDGAARYDAAMRRTGMPA